MKIAATNVLLGIAAFLILTIGLQAADRAAKAEPGGSVKICNLFGAGFYTIPGSDICLKMGGWVRFEAGEGYNGSFLFSPLTNNLQDRSTNEMVWRGRGYITADARQLSDYGTIRSYIAVGLMTNSVGLDTAANTFSSNRAFIQWAGFTAGLARSFFDFYGLSTPQYSGGAPNSNLGDNGWWVLAYTALFERGLSATISTEVARRTSVFNAGTAAGALVGTFSPAGLPSTTIANSYGGLEVPDFIVRLRADEAWGSVQIMGALHDVSGSYYSASIANAHPADALGFALGAGIKLNSPLIGDGDYLQAQFTYGHGASRYAYTQTAYRYANFVDTGSYGVYDGNNVGFGILTDGVYGGSLAGVNASNLELTNLWVVNAGYEHFWNPEWRTSLWGTYQNVTYSQAANAMLCSAIGAGAGVGTIAVATPGCDMNWSFWALGSRTQWNVTPDFYVGLEAAFMNLNSAHMPNGTAVLVADGTKPPGSYRISDEGAWLVRFRVHKDFHP